MNAPDLKWACAQAALPLISEKMTIGLGGGTTISHLVDLLSQADRTDVRVVTPSQTTRDYCLQKDFTVLNLQDVSKVDVAFDGCDQVDQHFNALKSGGAIHTREKLVASMADDYILLVDESKFVDSLTFDVPVTLEVLPDAYSYVQCEIQQLGGHAVPRKSPAKDGFTISDYGNIILDASFAKFPNIASLDQKLREIHGIVDTSLFVGCVTKIIVTSPSGSKILEK
ncbi:ribose 5-phosphate isomerase A [Sporolactobacillus spathodeae]|uniref:Ribose 5-phosphate isomerase A n=1 Tax=Sporolactobacillus spathodeae TaxID=1465502 RepID=A0ABS2Q5Z9_9BACL|nr:ribose 5-phosphate isomerase A [Sporolactobacillus spathodeae]MBM7656865.1 ribose 5-phosphate isomerase A [Sporolactobacillus spathodeae]